MLQIIFTIIFLIWMFIALGLWFSMWRDNTQRTGHMQQALVDVTLKMAESAIKSADAAQRLATFLEAEKKRDLQQ